MKAVSIVLSVIAGLLLALIAFFFIGGTLRTQVEVSLVTAQQASEAVEEAVEAFNQGHVLQRFGDVSSVEASECVLHTVRVTLSNPGMFAAEWLGFSVSPGEGDAAVFSDAVELLDIPANQSAQLELEFLARQDGSGKGRSIQISYYVLGMRRTVSASLE